MLSRYFFLLLQHDQMNNVLRTGIIKGRIFYFKRSIFSLLGRLLSTYYMI